MIHLLKSSCLLLGFLAATFVLHNNVGHWFFSTGTLYWTYTYIYIHTLVNGSFWHKRIWSKVKLRKTISKIKQFDSSRVMMHYQMIHLLKHSCLLAFWQHHLFCIAMLVIDSFQQEFPFSFPIVLTIKRTWN